MVVAGHADTPSPCLITTRATGKRGAQLSAPKGEIDARAAQHEVEVPWAAGPGLRRCLARRARGQTGMERPVASEKVSNVSSFRAEKSGS